MNTADAVKKGFRYGIALASLVLVMGLVLSSCEPRRPLKEASTNNSTYKVDLLFTDSEGCRVYRFEDHGYSIYYTNCTAIMQPHCTGKVCRYDRETKGLPPEISR